ncbi:unnamed protein product [Durusdinium trenchii]|uniref:Uncharacterized protein n=1 Tax=Durusdinium trenchii TaxID=1381693 RepID=A0ABP0SD95_9DINO
MTPPEFDALVKRLIALQTPKVVVLLVLLVWWLDLPKEEESPYQVLEFFSGVGRIAALSKLGGLRSAAVDIVNGEEVLDASTKDLFDSDTLVAVQDPYGEIIAYEDAFVKTCRKKAQLISEDDLFVDGQFMSEQDMIDEGFKEPRIAGIKAECAQHAGSIRQQDEFTSLFKEARKWLELREHEKTFCPLSSQAKAPAVSLAQHADALQEELEDHEPLPLSTTGVLGCQHKNSSRQYKRVVARKIPTSYHQFEENGGTVRLPYLKPTDMLKYLLSNEPWILLGGLEPGQEAEDMLATFWRLYKSEHSTHAVYKMAEENRLSLSQTIPVFLHGDGGRTQKKAPLEVVSFRPALGLDTEINNFGCTCNPSTVYCGDCKLDPLAQRLNNRNHSYLTHFLIFAFPSKKFKSTPGLFKSMLDAASMDLRAACCDGISVGNSLYHVAVLGMAGDMEYHTKSGTLNRSYQNVGSRNFLRCCAECWAGDIRYPFEDVSTCPAWLSTLYNSPPWTQTPPFKHIPFEDWNTGAAGRFFKKDPMHIFRLGIARNFIGSTIVLFCLEGVWDSPGDSLAIDNRLIRAWSSFALWCDANNVTCGAIRSFSKAALHMPRLGVFPFIGGKASDSIYLLKWLKFVSGLEGVANPTSTLFPLVLKAAVQGLNFQCIHRHGLWLPVGCRDRIIRYARDFVQSYAWLAQYAYQRNLQLYGMVPKLHAMHHFPVQLGLQHGNSFCANPALFDCSSSEDFVGRISRQSRRVSNVNVVENTILAYRVKSKMIIKRFKRKKQ